MRTPTMRGIRGVAPLPLHLMVPSVFSRQAKSQPVLTEVKVPGGGSYCLRSAIGTCRLAPGSICCPAAIAGAGEQGHGGGAQAVQLGDDGRYNSSSKSNIDCR